MRLEHLVVLTELQVLFEARDSQVRELVCADANDSNVEKERNVTAHMELSSLRWC